jgi:DNA-binding Lrp family transcriptional regulator
VKRINQKGIIKRYTAKENTRKFEIWRLHLTTTPTAPFVMMAQTRKWKQEMHTRYATQLTAEGAMCICMRGDERRCAETK